MLVKVFCVCLCVLLCFICVFCQLDEGSSCIHKADGINGTCASFNRCLSVVYDVKQKKHPQLCSFNGREPIICCTDCDLVNDTSNVLVDKFGSHYFKTGVKSADKCLEYISNYEYSCPVITGLRRYLPRDNSCYMYEPYIVLASVGGTNAYVGEFPHMAVEPLMHFATLPIEGECLEYRVRLDFPCDNKKKGLTRQMSYGEECYIYEGLFGIQEVGGVDAKEGEYPHMALLGYGDDLNTAQWLCGGSIISERFVLTAGHCISSNSLGPVRYVALGILKRTDPSDKWQRYFVRRAIPYPDYKPPIKYHDIALLEVEPKITFSRLVLPACINTGTNLFKGQAVATGWGALGHRQSLADTLQVVILQQFSDEECAAAYPTHRHLPQGYDQNTQACYGDKLKVIDTCEGDSGGPLQVASGLGRCVYEVIGVTSYGSQCGFLGSAGMYTRVEHYVPWIESVVWPS